MTDDATRRTVPGLAKAREARDMTQGCLAEAAGVSEKTVRRAEAGQAVSPETRMALKAVLGDALVDPRASPALQPGPETSTDDHGPRKATVDTARPRRWESPPMPGPARRNAALALLTCLALGGSGIATRWCRDAGLPPGYTRVPDMRLAMRVVAFDEGLTLPDGLPGDRNIEQVDPVRAAEIIAAASKAGGLVGPVNDLKASPYGATLLGLSEEDPYLQVVTTGPCSTDADLSFRDGKCGHFGVVRTGTKLTASKVNSGLLLDLDWQDVTRGGEVFDEARPEPPVLTKSGTQSFVPDGSGKVAMARLGRNVVFVDALPGGPTQVSAKPSNTP